MNTHIRKNSWLKASYMAAAIAVIAAFWLATASSAAENPPGSPFKKVSQLVALPDYVPGLGTLYVDPATLPVGPFLGYNRDGKLSQITYMIPMKDINNYKNFKGLATFKEGLKIKRTDIAFNPGHPGVAEPHYHITLWLIDPMAQEKM